MCINCVCAYIEYLKLLFNMHALENIEAWCVLLSINIYVSESYSIWFFCLAYGLNIKSINVLKYLFLLRWLVRRPFSLESIYTILTSQAVS
jgi:hypothetical protein